MGQNSSEKLFLFGSLVQDQTRRSNFEDQLPPFVKNPKAATVQGWNGGCALGKRQREELELPPHTLLWSEPVGENHTTAL